MTDIIRGAGRGPTWDRDASPWHVLFSSVVVAISSYYKEPTPETLAPKKL